MNYSIFEIYVAVVRNIMKIMWLTLLMASFFVSASDVKNDNSYEECLMRNSTDWIQDKGFAKDLQQAKNPTEAAQKIRDNKSYRDLREDGTGVDDHLMFALLKAFSSCRHLQNK